MVKPVTRKQNELYKPVTQSQEQQSQWQGRKITMPSSHAQGPITVLRSNTGSCDVVRIRTAYIALGCFILAWGITSIILIMKSNPYEDSYTSRILAGVAVAVGGGVVSFIAIGCINKCKKNDYEPV
jgi:hypothetical protein